MRSLLWLLPVLASPSLAQTNFAVSVNDVGELGDGVCQEAMISGNGRYVVFSSRAENLAPNSSGNFTFVFRHDLMTRTTEAVSVLPDGTPADRCFWPDVSDDGRFVAFYAARDDLVAGDVNGEPDIFVRDMLTGSTEIVSIGTNGMAGDGISARPKISGNGRFVAFDSYARFDARDVNVHPDIYRYDRHTNTLDYVSVTQAGVGADSWSIDVDICSSGEMLVFRSRATNLGTTTVGDVNIYLKDMRTGELRQIDRPSGATTSSLGSAWPAISGSGQVVAFTSALMNLVPGDVDFQTDVYTYDVATDSIEKISLRPDGLACTGSIGASLGISFRGRFVSFTADSDDLLPGGNGFSDEVYVRDRLTGTTERVSVGWAGVPGNRDSLKAHIDSDGHTVTFLSRASNLVQGSIPFVYQVFARDLREDIGTAYCATVPNSTGMPSTIDGLGFSAVNRNEVTLRTASLPPSVLTFFLASLSEGFLAQPGGSVGNLCLGGFIGRYVRPGEVQDSGLLGAASLRVDLTSLPQPTGSIVVGAGTTVYFQGWHRDLAAGTVTSNFTPGLRISFL